MTIVIDPDFSVYKLVNRMRDTSTILTHRRTMSLMSYEIENATIVEKAHTRVFAGFQRLSKFVPQMKRYAKLAQHAESVYVFGIPDVALPPIKNITYVYLEETDQLAKEWFLVSHGEAYHSILATEELSDIDDPDETRVFQGIWTFSPDMVKIVEEWISSAVDAVPLSLDNGYDVNRQSQIMGTTIQSLLKRTETQTAQNVQSPVKNIINTEVKTVVKDKLMPELDDRLGDAAWQGFQERQSVIMFSDIRNFTTLAEQYKPSEVVEKILNPYINVLSEAIAKHGGVVDKFLGDGILATFGLAGELDNPAQNALQASIEAIENLQKQGFNIPIGVGISQGEVVVGEIGNAIVNETTVIGDVVNIAQRLSTLGYNGIWLCEDVYSNLVDKKQLTAIGEFQLKGKSVTNQVFRYNSVEISEQAS